MRFLTPIAAAVLAAGSAHAAINPIPTTNGFSGSVGVGIATNDVASNFYKVDGNERSEGLGNAPKSHNEGQFMPSLDLRYTLADSRTQFVLGNQIHDQMRLDYSQQLAVRQEVGANGIVSFGLVFNGIAPNEVWANPYASGERSDTKRKSNGVRLGWEGILGSNFSADITRRKIELDEERSGLGLGLSSAERALLDRNGDVTRVNVSYDWEFAPGQFLAPGVVYAEHDLDGRAMSSKSTGLKLDYGIRTGTGVFTTTAYVGKQDYDAANPIWNRKADADEYVIGVNYLHGKLFGYKQLSGYVNAAYGKSDSDIDFFDTEVSRVGAGVRYSF
ncbi:DUF2860 family protein [Crenobacter caeni]|uniref:DUF2860 domain-containing protein n=1 Tax=Crenobacter caeni TaxID=2705474 RepID=A0A6B2KUC5_9NEIS|nr:DUF2860 family protein [Crenobacter caeni]NDV13846.1 DUF2860 domain-containing protein [Crenobacter caeni]